MSRHSSHERAVSENTEVLEVIREEQCSPAISSVNMDAASKTVAEEPKTCVDCTCAHDLQIINDLKVDPEEIDRIMTEREEALRREFQERIEVETNVLKERFDFILQNEQVRASYMLREAHRERQEKISALQTQLECKNLAGLMYVMCTERRKSKLERLRLIEEYTSYIRALQSILEDGQELILRLSRGYKTAARVDHEWREKMKKIIREFQAYVYKFGGGTAESNQYLFDLPALLKTEAPIVDNLKEDPIEDFEEEGEDGEEHDVVEDPDTEKPWWELIEGDCKPFVMFGDMAEFRPPQRREVLKTVKAAKSAPRQWKEYVFNEMFLRSDCSNADVIKDEYPKMAPSAARWECQAVQTDRQMSKTSFGSRRVTTTSIDVRGNMGSILKIISSNMADTSQKPNILAARDSMEIASTTALAKKMKYKHHKETDHSKVILNIGSRKTSMYDQAELEDDRDEQFAFSKERQEVSVEDEEEESLSILGSVHNDSLQVISHKPEKDHKIHYEKVCPMEKCQRLEVDSFIRSLPPYMRANPFTHFEQSYEDYETCTPEQLEILKQRIEDKKKKNTHVPEVSPLSEWTPEEMGVAVQTSDASLPPCTCLAPTPTPVSSAGRIFNLRDLFPIKQTLNEIRKDCFYDGNIEFDRFKVIGQESNYNMNDVPKEDFQKKRLNEIKRILKQHPSLCDMFQANTRC